MERITRYYEVGGGIGEGGAAAAGTTKTAAELAAEAATAEQATLETLLSKEEAQLTTEEKASLITLKGKYNIEELNEDGTALTPEQKTAKVALEKKLTDTLAKPENQRTLEEIKFIQDNIVKPVSVYEEVDQLSGISVSVDYGTVNPLSAEGIMKREEALRTQAVQEYDQQLKEETPLAYQFMLHLKQGGTAEDFLARETDNYQDIELTKTDVAGQESIYRKSLTLKGNTAEQVDALVQIAKDKGKLFESSKVELVGLQKRQALDNQKREQGIKAQQGRETQLTNSFFSELDKALNTGIKGVTIPKAEHKAFAEFVKENTYMRDGKLLYIKELDPKNLQEELAANYFKFKKGDLSAIVTRRAASLNAERVKAAIKYKITPKSEGQGAPKYVPMSQI